MLNRDSAQLAASDSKPHAPYSLLAEILDFALVPIMIAWPIAFVVFFVIATDVANRPYDTALADSTRALASQLRLVNGEPLLLLPNPAQAILHADETDRFLYRVTREGVSVGGDPALAPVTFDDERHEYGRVYFRDEIIEGEETRVAFLFTTLNDGSASAEVLVQVGETLLKRKALAGSITSIVLTILYLVIPLMLFLVWFGLTRGLAPLAALKRRIERRRSNDLSPINPYDAPEELSPLIVTINEQMARVARNLKTQERFVADAAHQMRTPLAGLKTQAETAMLSDDPRDVADRLTQISVSVDHASHLIRQLLTLARADDSEVPHQAQRLDLNPLVRDVMLGWGALALKRRMDFSFEPAADPAWINGDPTLLAELFNNFIDNALKYTPEGGRITVRIYRLPGGERPLVVDIEDTGIGIAEADRELVFERFYRALGTTASGSGLGLPIVRGIARRHNAAVTLFPNPGGRGTLARASFPAAAQG